jgi:hypothetical protein
LIAAFPEIIPPSLMGHGAVPVAPQLPFQLYRQAFDQALPAAAAISEDELMPVNLDVPSAVATAIGALPKILAYREEAAMLHGFDISHFDRLQLYTFAVGHAHARFLAASAPPEALASLTESGTKLRDTMHSDAVALAHRGLVNGDRVAEFKGSVGYKNLAFDLLGLAALLRESWDKIVSRTAIQLRELLGRQLMDAVGAREQAPAMVAHAQAQRQRNFTLFSRSYDQVRRAILYLRWDKEDIDQVCPSLYAGRGGSRRKETPAPTTPVPDTTDHASRSAPAGTTFPAFDKTPAASAASLPGGNPFLTDDETS